MLTLWLFLPLGAIFVFIGLAVHVFKWYSMISGYNTMSKEQKANVDVEGLSKAVGIFCYVNGGLFLLTGILSALGVEVSVFIPFGVLLVSTPYFVSSVRKYDKNTETQKAAKGLNWTMLITLVLVAVLFFFATRPTNINVGDEGIQITGLYGGTYTWESIESVSLEDTLPKIEMRTNGSKVGSHLKGYFRTTEFGQVKMALDAAKPPFIYMRTDGKMFIFNAGDSEKTRQLYEEIADRLQ